MLNLVPIVAAVLVTLFGASIWWSNPRRPLNRGILFFSLHGTVWLILLYIAIGAPGRLTWLRAMCAVSAFIPLNLAMLEETIAWESIKLRFWWRSGPLAALCIALAIICWTEVFIPSHSTDVHRVYSWGYPAYIVGAFVGYLYVIVITATDMQRVPESRRLEMRIWQLGAGAMVFAILLGMVLNMVTKSSLVIRLQPVVILAFAGATTFAITTYRVFDAGQILRMVVTSALPVVLALLAAGGAAVASERFGGGRSWLFAAVVVALLVAGFSHRWLARVFELYPEDTASRRAALEAARSEVRLENLERRFGDVLRGWARAEFAVVASGASGNFTLAGGQVATDSLAVTTLRQVGWATPERLARERPTPGRVALAQFLAENRLAIAVIGQGPTIMVLAGVGVPASRRPFSYPQAMQLGELTSIFEGPLERAHLTEKMQHAEQLATVGMLGASLAHEIRNPLVSLKAFVQLLPTRHHEPAFREKFFTLMSEEVKRIDRLTEQLLDLASPRAYQAQPIELNAVVTAGLELVKPRVHEADARLIVELCADAAPVLSDAAAVKQVLLNLCLNAVQVLDKAPEKWVRVTTRRNAETVELTVSDSGPGIAPEIRNKLFQPFQSTKSSGFGLGLAICRDILTSLGASIAVAPPEPGKGAMFRVTFPCP